MSQTFSELPSKKIKNIVGETFGRLKVVSFSHIANNKGKNAYWNCECECGNTSKVSSRALRGGCTQSCGCLASELSRKRIKEIHNTGKHLYFIKCGDYIKIGRANNPTVRLSQIRAANPYETELLFILEDEGDTEKDWHKLFAEKHHTGEWFKLTKCDITDIIGVKP
tara:strand:+ start:861 stop:1361 length:501 start_codon:yes stop_codon:yes gene_type:complete